MLGGGSGAAGLLQTHLGRQLIPDPPGTRWSRAFSQPDFSLHVFPETMFSFVWSWPSKEFQSKTKQNKICFQAFTLLNPRWVSGRLATGSRAAFQPPSSLSPATARSSLCCCRGPWRFAVGPPPPRCWSCHLCSHPGAAFWKAPGAFAAACTSL